jgi:hypothetical protein
MTIDLDPGFARIEVSLCIIRVPEVSQPGLHQADARFGELLHVLPAGRIAHHARR